MASINGTPYQWGPNVMMYNTKAFNDKAPESWDVVFKEMTLPDGKVQQGRVQAYDGRSISPMLRSI